MKVVFVTRESSQFPAVRVRCHGFAKYLNEAGIPAEVFSYADDLGAKSGTEEKEMSLGEKLHYNLKAFRKLSGPDVLIFLQRANYHSLAPLLVKFLKKGSRLIFDLDDWEARENGKEYLGGISNSGAEMAMRFIASRSDYCIAASNFLQKYLSSYARKVDYIPTGVDTDVFAPAETGTDSSLVRLSWMGTLYRRDNLENLIFLVDCYEQVRKGHDNLRLEILTEGTYLPALTQYVREKKMPDILLKKWIQPQAVPAYLNDIDIALMPLIQESKFNKAKSPTRVFEAMAMEKPVLASAIGETPLIIEDGQDGMLARTKDEFISKLNTLIADRGLRENLGRNARKKVMASYSLRGLSLKIINNLKRLL